jgi:hypothetical protein
VVIDEREQVVPPFDQLAFSLVLNEFNLLCSPELLDLVQEILEDGLTPSLRKYIVHSFCFAEQVCTPKLR